MKIPIARDLGRTAAAFSPRETSNQGHIAAEAFVKPMRPPHEPQPPKPKVEKLPSLDAYRGLMMRGIR